MPYATMADAHREWHRNTGVPMGTPGCPQDACHLPDLDPEDYAAYSIQTSYGTLYADSMAEAREMAREAAMTTGRRTVIKKIEREVPEKFETEAPSLHEPVCVCGPYDRCKGVREDDARRSGNWRDLHRAYND